MKTIAEHLYEHLIGLPDGKSFVVTRVHDEITVHPLLDRVEIGPAADKVAVEAALAADREAALRDVFATAAIGAIITENGAYVDRRIKDAHCLLAYEYADAMLEARKKA